MTAEPRKCDEPDNRATRSPEIVEAARSAKDSTGVALQDEFGFDDEEN